MDQSLKDLRQQANMTQKEAAEFLKVSLRSYQSYENDRRKRETLKYEYLTERLGALSFMDETHGILSLAAIQDACATVFAKYPIHYCYLFGSYAKGQAREDSDVDLLISTELTGLPFFALIDELSELLRKKIDALDARQLLANPQLLHEVLKNGVKIVG